MKLKTIVLAAMTLLLANPIFAQTTEKVTESNQHWLWITAGFAMAIASAVCGLAQGRAVAAACEAMARNPGAAKSIQGALLLGLALIESLALYTLMIVFLKVK
jgi:F-type H+-transporting ATPase subunit c